MNVVEVKNLSKSYKNLKAVDNVSFNVKKGEILGLLGPNGSGKSTTINSILSLLKIDSGEIKLFGEVMSPSNYKVKKNIGVIFQEVGVFDELTVKENIDYFCGLYISDKNIRKKYAMDAIKLVHLEDFVNFYPKQLSGGLLRRLNIACGISHKPKLIFLDEPTSQVDPQSRNSILDSIKSLSKEGASIVYTTHYMEEVEILCDNIIILDKGKIIASGTNDELKNLIDVEEKITIEVNDVSEDLINSINEIKEVIDVRKVNNNIIINYKKGKSNLENLIMFLKKNKIKYNKIFSERPTLNDVFLSLTGKELRD